MQKSTKAVLLSGLVFPGLGHLYLRRWLVGLVLSGVAGCAIYWISSTVVAIALDVSHEIATGAIPADIATVTHVVSLQLDDVAQATNLASVALFVCWVAGIVGSYRQGRILDQRDAAGQHTQRERT